MNVKNNVINITKHYRKKRCWNSDTDMCFLHLSVADVSNGQCSWSDVSSASRGLLPLSRALLPSSFNFLNKWGSPYLYWKIMFHAVKIEHIVFICSYFCSSIPLFLFTASLSRVTMHIFTTVIFFSVIDSFLATQRFSCMSLNDLDWEGGVQEPFRCCTEGHGLVGKYW